MAYITAQFFKGLDIETAELVASHIRKSKKKGTDHSKFSTRKYFFWII